MHYCRASHLPWRHNNHNIRGRQVGKCEEGRALCLLLLGATLKEEACLEWMLTRFNGGLVADVYKERVSLFFCTITKNPMTMLLW